MLGSPSTLTRKLLRDIRGMGGQILTISLVVAAGVASFVALQSTWQALLDSRDRYYYEYRFGDVFVTLERAPEGFGEQLEAVPGVATAYTRLVAPVRIPLETGTQPPIGIVVGLPRDGRPALNDVLLRQGRMVEPGRADEALLLDVFAEVAGLAPGDTLPVVMEGVLRQVRITGLATSPEFVFASAPGGDPIPDDERFAVLWMDRASVAPAFQMEGAFNDAVFRLSPGASEETVIAELDRALEPYGGRGAVGRDRQRSNYFLQMRLDQLEALTRFVPLIFLGVAAFLLNVVLSRLVKLQRTEIAGLRALGYQNREIGGYYVRLVGLVVLLGTALGALLGGWMGQGITGFFTDFFRLPLLEYGVSPGTVVAALLVAFLFGALGAFVALRQILSLSPAEAMAPPAPSRYRPSLLERLGVGRLLGSSGRMVLREITRRPLRTGLSSLGIALAIAVVIASRFSVDGFDFIVENHYERSTRENVAVALTGPTLERATREVGAVPGVIRSEGLRSTPVRVRSQSRWRDVVFYGYQDDGELRQLLDVGGSATRPPSGGVVLTGTLAEMLGVGPGDTVRVELREGRGGTHPVPVTGTVDEMFGLQGHMRLDDLNRLLGEGPTVNSVLLAIEPGTFSQVEARLATFPGVAQVTEKARTVQRIRELSAEPQRAMVFFLTLFGSIIAVGIVYNNARVALSVRARDLASLRVLGFTRKEISGILLGEMAVEVLVAIPFGLALGRLFSQLITRTLDLDEYRIPLMVTPETYAFAISMVLLAAVASALLVRRRLDRLDLIGVLKTRE